MMQCGIFALFFHMTYAFRKTPWEMIDAVKEVAKLPPGTAYPRQIEIEAEGARPAGIQDAYSHRQAIHTISKLQSTKRLL